MPATWIARTVTLPAQHVGAYRRRNKTDAADAEALLEAARNAQIKDVPVKNETQQLVMAVHAMREGWKAARTAKINALRGHLLGFGQSIPLGTEKAIWLAWLFEMACLSLNTKPCAVQSTPAMEKAMAANTVAVVRERDNC